MRYYLFLDECGDQNLASFDPSFPVFTLCGILVSEMDYAKICSKVVEMKQKYWNGKKIILHSRDIRKCEKGFEILFDLSIKKSFYEDLNNIMEYGCYTIVSCSILKEPYIRKYGRLGDVYGLSLSYIIERAIFYLDAQNRDGIELYIYAEKRGKKEDAALLDYYNTVLDSRDVFCKTIKDKSLFQEF